MARIDFTLSNARRFYSSMGNPLGVKGLTTWKAKYYVPVDANLVFFFLKVGFNGFDVNKLFAPLESSNDSVPFRLSKERKYLQHKLFQAVLEDDLLALNTLIKKQVNFGIQDFDKRTPL